MNSVTSGVPEPQAELQTLYGRLMAFSEGLPNDDLFARMLASWQLGEGELPACMGLTPADFEAMLARHFPGFEPVTTKGAVPDPERAPERDELYQLIAGHRRNADPSEEWITQLMVAACMAGNHLWQDLGLWSRKDLSRMIGDNFPALAAKNDRDMKWKKFFYKQLCVQEGIYTCRSPSCEVCPDYADCFGPEE